MVQRNTCVPEIVHDFHLYIVLQCMLSGFPAHIHSIHTNKRMSIKKRSKHKTKYKNKI